MPVAVRSKIFTNLLKTKFRDPANFTPKLNWP